MQNIHKTRFLAANYSNLQGLKAVPLGLLLLAVVLWANGLRERAEDLSLPILFSVSAAALIAWANRFYRAHYGRVESTPRQRKTEWAIGVAGGIIGLTAFFLDTLVRLPISMVGLVFAAAVVTDYLRMQWYAPGRYLFPLALVSFLILLTASILPILGGGAWWRWLDLRGQLYGVLFVAGVVITLNGLIGHFYLAHQLPAPEQ